MTRSQIIPALQAVLTTALAPHVVVANNLSEAARDTMEGALRGAGVCIVVAPVLGSRGQGQAGPRVSERVEVAVHVRVNTTQAPTVDPYALVSTAINAVLASVELRAAAGGSDGVMTDLVTEDAGLHTTACFFTIPITN